MAVDFQAAILDAEHDLLAENARIIIAVESVQIVKNVRCFNCKKLQYDM